MNEKIEITPTQDILQKRIDMIHEEIILYGKLVEKHLSALSIPYFIFEGDKHEE